jgi:long-chain acyl-CoA synthetase
MKPETLNDIFSAIVERGQARVMMVQDGAQWRPVSSQELYQCVAGIARALTEWGISKGDRVAILSENRYEWPVTDFACLQLGAVVVPIYATLTAQQAAYILSDSCAKVVFVSTEQQLEKVLSIKNQTAVVEHVVVMDQVASPYAVHMQELMQGVSAARDPRLDACASLITPDDLASIIYTSGTTGIPKGVKLTHGNLASNIQCSLDGFEVRPGQISVSFLPLSHVTARYADFALLTALSSRNCLRSSWKCAPIFWSRCRACTKNSILR